MAAIQLSSVETLFKIFAGIYSLVCVQNLGDEKKNICSLKKAVFLEQLIYLFFSLSLSEVYRTSEFLGCNFLYLNLVMVGE